MRMERVAGTWHVPRVRSCAAALVALALGAQSARALTIELKDVAPDRVERQRAEAEGRVPLPGTPDLKRLEERRTALGVAAGAPVMIRIFKSEMQLELWTRKDDRFVLFAAYPICHFSGTLGPKQKEGDRQTPEGFYTITMRQMHHVGRWPRSLDLGFPNVFDRALRRNGSYILVHGGCSSVGCVAMTNDVNMEIYNLTLAALRSGQRYVPVHVFPFRLTDENLERHRGSEWHAFWTNLKDGYRSFETTHLPPKVRVCNGRYLVEDGQVAAPAAEPLPPARRGVRRMLYRDQGAGAIESACPAPQPEFAVKDSGSTSGPTPITPGADRPASEPAALGAAPSVPAEPQPDPASETAESAAGSPPPPAATVRDVEAGGAEASEAARDSAAADRVIERDDASTER